MTGWTPALRIARRGVRRNLGRSILIAALIAIPVGGAALVDVLSRTLAAPARQAERNLGAADAELGAAMGKIVRTPKATGTAAPVEFASLLPTGTRIVPSPVSTPIVIGREGATVSLSDPGAPALPGASGHVFIRGQASAVLVSADPTEPMHRQAAVVAAGRAPRDRSEVLVTASLAKRLGLSIGSTIQSDTGPLTVTGISRSPFCLSCDQVVALPDPKDTPRSVLVQLPAGTDKAAVWRSLEAQHVSLFTREGGSGEPPDGDAVRAAALVTLIAGFGLLEVILLAGTAFAVGARRQVRTLGLVAASGGTPTHVRRIVLAEGVVLGLLGALAGALAGSAIAVALRPAWEALDDAEITHWVFKPIDLTIAILIGTLSGVAAAAAPAIGAARMKPVDALAGRFRVTVAARRRGPTIGAALLAAGLACGLAGNAMLSDSFKAYETALAKVKETGGDLPQIASAGPVALILLGAVLLVAATVALAPTVIARLARVGGSLPVAGRLAVRDAARHRHRTGPTTSAIAVAVAGSVVLACVLAATREAEALQRVAALPAHTMALEPGPKVQSAAAAAANGLPGGRALTLTVPLGADDPGAPPGMPVSEVRGIMAEAPCAQPPCDRGSGDPLAIGDATGIAVAVLGGADEALVRRQLAAGRVVLFGAPGTGGAKTLTVHSGPDVRQLPGYVVERPRAFLGLPLGLMPESVARREGWELAPGRGYVAYSAKATGAQVADALDRATAKGSYASIDDPPKPPNNAILLVVVLGAAFITLAGAAISIALSSAEGRADLATLAAVGAAPRRRRALAASQALLIAGVGCGLGVLVGTFVAYTLRATTGAPGFVVPWANLGATAIVVPLLAMAVAAVFTPSRLPLVRRAA